MWNYVGYLFNKIKLKLKSYHAAESLLIATNYSKKWYNSNAKHVFCSYLSTKIAKIWNYIKVSNIITQPFSLALKVLKAKYLSNCTFWDAQESNASSQVWHSIVWGIEILEKGCCWQIMNGRLVKVFEDCWILRHASFKPITIHSMRHSAIKWQNC